MPVGPIDLNVRNIEEPFERASLERETQGMPNRAFCSVAGDEIFCVDRFRVTESVSDLSRDPGRVLGE